MIKLSNEMLFLRRQNNRLRVTDIGRRRSWNQATSLCLSRALCHALFSPATCAYVSPSLHCVKIFDRSELTQTSHQQKLRSSLFCNQQTRSVVSWLPEALQTFSIWGGSGFLLKSIHSTLGLPYWACFAAISVGVRTVLFPIVLYAAHTAARFAKIAPDVQFQLALFQKDMAQYRAMKASARQILFLMRTNIATLGATYKIHKVNPLTVFLSPVLQIPIFWYISVDMRKIVNGLDPLLAQNLVEGSVAWIPDLTEADPWFGLPCIAGVLLYGNMEVALGKRNMAGEVTAKADTALLLKDCFQSLAIFMPCFTAQLPAGVQIYIVTSFCFTLMQSTALRTESFRQLVGLPSMLAKPEAGRLTTQMMELKMLEQKAKELRGNGPVLGKGVLVHGWEVSFAGKYRPSSILGGKREDRGNSSASQEPLVPFRIQVTADPSSTMPISPELLRTVMSVPYIHGISAPLWQLQQQQQKSSEATGESRSSASDENQTNQNGNREYMPQYSDSVMEMANRGERPLIPSAAQPVLKPMRGVPYQPLAKVSRKHRSKKRR
jgi:membrane protein insertase Oxa1/YidC/SpoIIIJ